MPKVIKFHKANSAINGEWGKQNKWGKKYTSGQRRIIVEEFIRKEIEFASSS